MSDSIMLELEEGFSLNESWLNGKHRWTEGEGTDNEREIVAEISTAYSTISIEEEGRTDGFFAQGEAADEYIAEIHLIWVSSGTMSTEDAVKQWAFINGIEY